MKTDRPGNYAQMSRAEIENVRDELLEIRDTMVRDPALAQSRLAEVHESFRDSARNLVHYLCLRRRDLRPLQLRLAALGLSSLGRAESHVLTSIDAVLQIVSELLHEPWAPPHGEAPPIDFAGGLRLAAEHADAVLGRAREGRTVRIMVTMPSEAADDYLLMRDLLEAGMDCMRINCAHDDAVAWSRMIENLRRAEQAEGRSCKVVMDLGGPKLRTGPLEPGQTVARIRPTRDALGRVTTPARIWLTNEGAPHAPPSAADTCLAVPGPWLARAQAGSMVHFTDARDARRSMRIVDVAEQGCWAEIGKTSYLVPGTVLRHHSVADDDAKEAPVGALPSRENELLLRPGDTLVVTRDVVPGRSATYDSARQLLTPATIGCTIPEVFDDVRAGDAIWFDDGRIGGVVARVEPARVLVRITMAREQGAPLRADKGINLPDSELRLSSLTAKDIEDLGFVARHADVVELSFANTPADVEALQEQLARHESRQPAIVIKTETRRGFEHLPEMLLTAMRMPRCGVMIARGDLAVECGFERLAEVQEEILWICEAAHVPVIWATQVLETLAKDGMPSRAEITDAAMGDRAECVMLNKGPHVVSAVRVLDDILRRMQSHQSKKRSMLRELHLAHVVNSVTPSHAP